MMSKRFFFKYMLQDIRHRIWMIALSVLACFLALPIAYLIWEGNSSFGGMDYEQSRIRYIQGTVDFFAEYPIVLGGVIAVVGALIVGIFGFRFVFRRKMVDLYHSLPITRNCLYAVTYLNGFLIWFVPFVLSLFVSVLMACCNVYEYGGMEACGEIMRVAASCVGVLTVSFLLMYHLVLVAAQLSGNILNTLVSIGIIGTAVFAVICTGEIFLNTYMETFYGTRSMLLDKSIFASPLISSVYQLYWYSEGEVAFAPIICANIVVVLLLGGGAWYLYRVRASELAEQGVKNPIATFLMKMVTAAVSGAVGWFIFTGMVGKHSMGWGIFGAVLVSVLAYGVLDIIFRMDFKAFFANKVWMAVTTVLSILFCLTISMDWIGYDAYVPDTEDIAEAAFLIDSYRNQDRSYRGSYGGPLEQMHFEDAETIQELLKVCVENEDYALPLDFRWTHGDRMDRMDVKVTLKNGRSYYRSYKVYDKDVDLIWPLICNEEYIKTNYAISEALKEEYVVMRLRREDGVSTQELEDIDLMRRVVEAYNKDLQEHPEATIAGEGRLLVNIHLRTENWQHSYISVYEGMTNTIEVLQNNPWCQAFLVPIAAQEVDHIILELGYYSEEEIINNGYDYELLAKERYGLLTEEDLETLRQNYEARQMQEKQPDAVDAPVDEPVVYVEQTVAVESVGKELYVTVSEPEEIQELLDIISYSSPDRGNGAFTPYFIGIRLVDVNGVERAVYLREGQLPEKFIARFAELAEK